MRERLDTVKRQVGLPVLPSAGFDPESVAHEVKYEEQAPLEEMEIDYYASGSQQSAAAHPAIESIPRYQVDPKTNVHRSVYSRCPTFTSSGRRIIDNRYLPGCHHLLNHPKCPRIRPITGGSVSLAAILQTTPNQRKFGSRPPAGATRFTRNSSSDNTGTCPPMGVSSGHRVPTAVPVVRRRLEDGGRRDPGMPEWEVPTTRTHFRGTLVAPFMAVSVFMDGMSVYVANIYAPVEHRSREQFY
ncbi:unnamed protein product [Phytophthora fragariaefolia]|uniref:Unnamed protein product n=1 Tax=Phytophthora fragariaefolia TaxID=1490495 RepID=A0A9W7DBN9_9STRA|nr:unnamed protein product [Phytophthora fragariaefolia]